MRVAQARARRPARALQLAQAARCLPLEHLAMMPDEMLGRGSVGYKIR